MEENKTGDLEYVGDCPFCGHPCYRWLFHTCPTAPKSDGWRAGIGERREGGGAGVTEMTKKEWNRYYQTMGLIQD